MAALCEAVALTNNQPQRWRDLGSCQGALYELLYRHGVDEIGALEVVESQPNHLTLIGRMTWVETQTDDLVEATFTFDEDSQALKGFVIRAGVESAGSATPACARRPESDTQWSVVIRAPSC
jgi:hypothetical protein